PIAARRPVLAAAPMIPIAGGRNAAAQEIVEQIAHQLVFAETRAGVVEALLLELPLNVLKLASAGRQDFEPLALVARFPVFFAQPGPRLVDLGDDGVV